MNWAQYALFLLVVAALVKPLGGYMARVFEGRPTFLDPLLRPLERGFYRLVGVDPDRDMPWTEYAYAFLASSLFATLLLYAILRLQHLFPWFYPAYMTTPMTPDLAFNTAFSFTTTTTWQAYAGESTMSYWSQTAGLTFASFFGGIAGLAIGMAFIRGLARERTDRLGSFWVDFVRATLYVILPISFLGSLFLVWQGVPCNFHPYVAAVTVEGGKQLVAQGPIAVLEFIKNLGTNGGGFFNVNGAHPLANPTPLANFAGMLSIAVLPAAFTYTFGKVTGRTRQGWLLFGVMALLFTAGLFFCDLVEQGGNPLVARTGGVAMAAGPGEAGGNMEGKEVRFGIAQSVLTAITTSNGATGSYNSMHDSYLPLGGMVPLINMLLGEIIFGGLGAGLYSILFTAFIGVFVAGLMIGRTPEYLGKELGPHQLKLIMLYTLAGPLAILVLTAIAVVAPAGLAGLTTNAGFHGFSEVLYAYTSCLAKNGQNFAGLSANSPFYNFTLAITIVVGRYFLAIPALALAGSFARQARRAATKGTLPTDSFPFAAVIVGTVLIVGGLSYFPALSLGPVVEHLRMVGEARAPGAGGPRWQPRPARPACARR
jgi:K+-transporting ATPase ATPase A chain